MSLRLKQCCQQVKKEIDGGEEEIITAVPIGRNQMCWQNFTPHNNSPGQNKSPEQKINNDENHPSIIDNRRLLRFR